MQQNNQEQFREIEENNLYNPFFLFEKKYNLYSVSDYINGLAYKNADFSNNGIPIIKISELKNGISNSTKFTNKQFNNKYFLNKGDLLFSWSGNPKTSIDVFKFNLKNGWLNQHIFKIIPKINNIYFFYLLKYLKPNLISIASNKQTNGLGHITIQDLKNIIIKLPEQKEQQKIAEILSSLDDKIELLKQQNKTLENIGQTIFKRWFVDFEFPDENEKPYKSSGGRMIEGELGEMPDGWRVGSINEKYISEIISSGVDFFDNEKIYLATADVSNSDIINTSEMVNFKNKPSRANMQPLVKSVWFAKMQNSKKLLMFDDYSNFEINNFILSTGFCGLKTNDISHYYLWSYILTDKFDDIKNNLANGAVQIAINNESLHKIRIFFPDIKILSLFNSYVKDIFEKIYYNNKQIQTLSKFRDSLLPKLMSGKIRVK